LLRLHRKCIDKLHNYHHFYLGLVTHFALGYMYVICLCELAHPMHCLYMYGLIVMYSLF